MINKYENNFTKHDTNIVKGVAILAMFFHHTWPNNPGIPVSIGDGIDFMVVLASSGKVCVSLLTILSGYGLAEKYRDVKPGFVANIRFCLSHYIQLMSVYCCILFWGYVTVWLRGFKLSEIYGYGAIGIRNIVLDVFGLGDAFNTPVFIGTWYITAIVFYYFMFPVLFYFLKNNRWITMIITYCPWVYYIIKRDIYMHTDSWTFYMFSFALGILLSQTGFLVSLKNQNSKQNIPCAVIFFILSFFARSFITMPADPLFAVSIIMMEIFVLSKYKVMSSFLLLFGTQSANIFLLQPRVKILMEGMGLCNLGCIYLFFVFMCLGFSLAIEEIKRVLRYDVLIRKVRAAIGY